MNSIAAAKQFAVLGIGRFGSALAKELYAQGKEVLAIDSDEQRVSDISEYVTHSVVLDCFDEQAMKHIGIDKFDVVIVAIGNNMQASILATLLCKEMGVKFVVAKAQNFQHSKVLEKIGADMVVFPESESGHKLAHLLASPEMVELAEIAPNFKIFESEVPESFIGKSLSTLKIRQKHAITLLIVNRKGEIFSSPDGEFVLELGDMLVLCGELQALQKFSKMI